MVYDAASAAVVATIAAAGAGAFVPDRNVRASALRTGPGSGGSDGSGGGGDCGDGGDGGGGMAEEKAGSEGEEDEGDEVAHASKRRKRPADGDDGGSDGGVSPADFTNSMKVLMVDDYQRIVGKGNILVKHVGGRGGGGGACDFAHFAHACPFRGLTVTPHPRPQT